MYDLFADADFAEPPEDRPRLPGSGLVLAAAGSGKTHRLTSRLISLLVLGVPPEEILVSTFTRKAAGEIAERVLLRLARGAATGKGFDDLVESLSPDLPPGALTRDGCGDLLVEVAQNLHRLQILTLDAFFYRVVRAFALELGVPLNWTLATEPEHRRLQSKAVEAVMRDPDEARLDDLLACVGQGSAERAVHKLLLQGARGLHESYVALDPAVPHPWGFEGGEAAFDPVDDTGVDELVDRLAEADLPRTQKGDFHGSWVKARDEAVDLLRRRDWSAFLAKGIAKAILEEKSSYYDREISSSIRDVHTALFAAARSVLGIRYQRGMEALGRFLPEFDRRMEELTGQAGLYRFEGLTNAIIRLASTETAEVFYRLDGGIRHVLLDEFQDTSNAQWAALEPLVREVLSSDGRDGRSVFIVADPKQSIFGWRGGEPRLLERIARTYPLAAETLTQSRRSSSVVLDLVNRVFGGIEHVEVLEDVRGEARGWAAAFHEHEPFEDRPGHARLEVGPEEEKESRGRLKPRLLEYAALCVRDLHESAPQATIGVLTRLNDSATHIMAHLKSLGVDASEEGGVPVTDSAPVLAILAALRMADHPLDRVSRYLAGMTPVGEILGLSAADWNDDVSVTAVIQRVRARLLTDGYGPVISEWSGRLAPQVSARDRRRLRQLGELAFRWDDRGALRPSEFAAFAESERVEDPASAKVRVMTIHRAKGLEFDAVVLPDLDTLSLSERSRDPFLPYREGGTGPVKRIFPKLKRHEAVLFPEVRPAEEQAKEVTVRDVLSMLYVGLTRARHAVHVFVAPDSTGKSNARTGARLLCEALAPETPVEEGVVLFEAGDPRWWEKKRTRPTAAVTRASEPEPGRAAPAVPIRFAPPRRKRLVQRATPTELIGEGLRATDALRRVRFASGRERGTVVHRWLETIRWLEDGPPGDDALLSLASVAAPGLSNADALVERFRAWIEAPEIRGLLSREAFPPGTEVETELPFLVRDGGRIIEGRIDRVLRIPSEEGTRMVVVDWKTDELDTDDPAAVDAKVAFYRPQVEAYRRALASMEDLRPDDVDVCVAFVPSGVARTIASASSSAS